MYNTEDFSVSRVKITNPFGLTSRQEQNLHPVPDGTLVNTFVVLPTSLQYSPKAPRYLQSSDRSCARLLILENYGGLSAIASAQRGNNADYLRFYTGPVKGTECWYNHQAC